MARWGLDYANLAELNPGLVMVSGCLFGQTGPQRSYPGFGGQGAAIAGFNHLTGLPDSEAHGPYATVTDSLAPRYVGLCIAAALLERRCTGAGQFIDVSQIETGVYSLSEMIVRYSANGEIVDRSTTTCFTHSNGCGVGGDVNSPAKPGPGTIKWIDFDTGGGGSFSPKPNYDEQVTGFPACRPIPGTKRCKVIGND